MSLGGGFVDLHCHYVPAVDDGVRTLEEGVQLCRALASIGYEKVVATPHIRTAMFPNTRDGLTREFERFVELTADVSEMPELGLGAEHFCDDVFWRLFETDGTIPYPGQKATLVEFPTTSIPINVEQRFFMMNVRGVRPVLAHPERYQPLFRKTEPIRRSLEIGVVALLDLMSLVGKYGRRPRKTAERMLQEGVYHAACSDCHRPGDVEKVEKAIERLRKLVGDEQARLMLNEHPRQILAGEVPV